MSENPLRRKKRVLKVACQVFARRGFEGTHIREICNLAGVNIALVCYHFRDKEGLYEAVQAEARKRLARRSKRKVAASRDITPEGRLQAITWDKKYRCDAHRTYFQNTLD